MYKTLFDISMSQYSESSAENELQYTLYGIVIDKKDSAIREELRLTPGVKKLDYSGITT